MTDEMINDNAVAPGTDDSGQELARIERGLFFIVGMGRSGTTLLQAMLSSHSRIDVPSETKFFKQSQGIEPPDNPADPDVWQAYLQRVLTNRFWLDQQLDPAEFVRRVSQSDRSSRSVFLTMLTMHSDKVSKVRIGEKTPTHFRKVFYLHGMFPDARFIHIYRDPRDVVGSFLRMRWSTASHLEVAGQWCKVMDRHEQYLEELPADVYTSVRFETLVEQLESELQRLCRFLDEPFEPAMLRYYERPEAGFADWEKPWKESTLRPLDKTRIGKFQQELSPRQIAVVQRVIGSRLQRYGYQPVENRRPLTWLLPDCYDELAAGWRRLRRKLRGRLRGRR